MDRRRKTAENREKGFNLVCSGMEEVEKRYVNENCSPVEFCVSYTAQHTSQRGCRSFTALPQGFISMQIKRPKRNLGLRTF
jgi:hypothetical protein